MAPKFESFSEFFPYYLAEHADPVCRGLHYIGTTLATLTLVYALYSQTWLLLLAFPVIGYGFAWVGHFIFEKNKPATFDCARWSLMGDYKMYWLFITGRLPEAMADALEKHGRRNSRGAQA